MRSLQPEEKTIGENVYYIYPKTLSQEFKFKNEFFTTFAPAIQGMSGIEITGLKDLQKNPRKLMDLIGIAGRGLAHDKVTSFVLRSIADVACDIEKNGVREKLTDMNIDRLQGATSNDIYMIFAAVVGSCLGDFLGSQEAQAITDQEDKTIPRPRKKKGSE